ncbi:MAG: AAA family ATPase, partial [Candidatus Thiodiazotropha sp.]
MFESYYKLDANPFRLSADESFRFAHKNYLKAWSYLSYALDQGEGFVMVSGKPGCGKTTLIRDILSELDTSKVLAINLVTNQLQAEELLRKVALEFGLPAETYNKATLLTRIEAYVEKQYEAGRRAIIVIDEAQNLTLNGLEELRLLSNLQSGNHPLFQIFLVGQDELRNLLLSSEMEHIRQRLIATCQIETMTVSQTEGYIEHRLGIVGWHGDPAFDPQVFPLIHRLTSGIPRKINHVVSRLLLYGALEKRHEFTLDDIWIVAEELFDEERLSVNSGESFESFKAGYSAMDSQQVDGADELSLVDVQSELMMPDTTGDIERYEVPTRATERQAKPPIVSAEESLKTEPTERMDQRQKSRPEESDLYLDKKASLFSDSEAFLADDTVDMSTTRIVNDNRTVADEFVEASKKSAMGEGASQESDETAVNWQAYSKDPEKTSRDTEEILNLPSMQAERRKHEINAAGGLINPEDSLESNELLTGGGRRFVRNLVLFTVAGGGILILALSFMQPELVKKQWTIVNAKVQSILTPKEVEPPINDGNVPALVREESSLEEGEVISVEPDENINPEKPQDDLQPLDAAVEEEVIEYSAVSNAPKETTETSEVSQTMQEQEGTPPDWETEYIGAANKDYIANQSREQHVPIGKPGLAGLEAGAE